MAIFRSYAGAWLYRVDVQWLCEAPYLQQQCSECRRCGPGDQRLPKDAAQYLVRWGVRVQEVLLDRCSRGHVVQSVAVQADGIPVWSKELARKVVLQCGRWRRSGACSSTGRERALLFLPLTIRRKPSPIKSSVFVVCLRACKDSSSRPNASRVTRACEKKGASRLRGRYSKITLTSPLHAA